MRGRAANGRSWSSAEGHAKAGSGRPQIDPLDVRRGSASSATRRWDWSVCGGDGTLLGSRPPRSSPPQLGNCPLPFSSEYGESEPKCVLAYRGFGGLASGVVGGKSGWTTLL